MKATRIRDCERRLILLEMLRNRHDHPSASDCVKDMRKLVPSIGSSTIYRHLGELTDSGLITEYRPSKGPTRFDAKNHDHAHFYCLKCHALIDVENFKIQADWPGSVQSKSCIVKGICDGCEKINNL
ncbi:transcriptional repressor [Patescibacteria group bacterium]|nr:transcriptional repressor [Patescibacteria group bacterium]